MLFSLIREIQLSEQERPPALWVTFKREVTLSLLLIFMTERPTAQSFLLEVPSMIWIRKMCLALMQRKLMLLSLFKKWLSGCDKLDNQLLRAIIAPAHLMKLR